MVSWRPSGRRYSLRSRFSDLILPRPRIGHGTRHCGAAAPVARARREAALRVFGPQSLAGRRTVDLDPAPRWVLRGSRPCSGITARCSVFPCPAGRSRFQPGNGRPSLAQNLVGIRSVCAGVPSRRPRDFRHLRHLPHDFGRPAQGGAGARGARAPRFTAAVYRHALGGGQAQTARRVARRLRDKPFPASEAPERNTANGDEQKGEQAAQIRGVSDHG